MTEWSTAIHAPKHVHHPGTETPVTLWTSATDAVGLWAGARPPDMSQGVPRRGVTWVMMGTTLHRHVEAAMRLGVHLVNFDLAGGPTAIGPTLARVGTAVDEAGIENLSVMDHYFQMEMAGGPEKPMLEGYTTLGFLAAHATAAELQLLVTGVTYRHPGLLAKIVTTLDVLSGGRAMLGIGAAWYDREHEGLGVPFPPVAERFERLE
jgi:hypothetical protein